MLSIISSFYNPFGFVAPYTLKGKKLLQQLCQDEVGWDETAPDKVVKEWQMWCNTLQNLDTYEVTRCYKLCGFGKAKEFWIHHFSDASEEGYGQVSFIRMVNCVGAIHCNFIMGKTKVTPKKIVSIPCLKLVAVTLSVKIKFLGKELNIDCLQETFWSDSKVVLGYIKNTTKKFKIFADKRIQQIHENSEVNQWRYVPR